MDSKFTSLISFLIFFRFQEREVHRDFFFLQKDLYKKEKQLEEVREQLEDGLNNRAIYIGYDQGRRGKSGHFDDLWDIVWPLYEVVVGGGWTIARYKIKPHIDL